MWPEGVVDGAIGHVRAEGLPMQDRNVVQVHIPVVGDLLGNLLLGQIGQNVVVLHGVGILAQVVVGLDARGFVIE